RIREAVKDADTSLLGLDSGFVECDEAYIGGQAKFMHAARKAKMKKSRDGYDHKTMVLGAIERRGKVRLQVGQKPATKEILRAFIKAKLADETKVICTDQHKGYQGLTDDNTINVT